MVRSFVGIQVSPFAFSFQSTRPGGFLFMDHL